MAVYQLTNSDLLIYCPNDASLAATLDFFELSDLTETICNNAEKRVVIDPAIKLLNKNQRFNLKRFLYIPIRLQLYIPLLFWHNPNRGLAIPYVAMPFNNRHINIEFNPLTPAELE